ncbi:MAG TPA: ATP-binding protein [Terriglobales bacterium]|nr:ATP-binding protein [Terriglobales bacterium]
MASSPNPDYRALSRRSQHRKRRRFRFERRIFFLSLLCALPGLLAFLAVIWAAPWTRGTKTSLLAVVFFVVLVLIALLHENIVHPIQTLSNVVSALREEDYSFRARGAEENDALGELALEINALADLLADQRTRTIEATALLRRVVEEIDVPIFAFDPNAQLRLVNSAGERLLQKPEAAVLGRSVDQIGLRDCFESENETQAILPQAPNIRWLVRKSRFRQGGVPHTLMVLSDVSRALRSEERSAWQRLIRVLGHELNNSLAPIKSIAGTLSSRLNSMAVPAEERQDFIRGLEIIETRSASLNRFLQAYRRLAQMPQPSLQPVNLRRLVERVSALETRVAIQVTGGPEVTVPVDPDQLEQMMINLMKNATEAALETTAADASSAAVSVGWTYSESLLKIEIKDRGPGLMNPDNVFVPFYTTKEEGTGIGLVLSRQIAEAHGGTIQLTNREDVQGCVATVLLPLKWGQRTGAVPSAEA